MAVNHFHKTPIGNFLQFSEYASWFWIYQDSEYGRVTQDPEYVGICRNMCAYA